MGALNLPLFSSQRKIKMAIVRSIKNKIDQGCEGK